MDTGYPAFIPEPYTHPIKTGKSRSKSGAELREDKDCDEANVNLSDEMA